MSFFSLNKNFSLKNSSELDMVFKTGNKISSDLIFLHYVISNDSKLKVAFSVGKKKHKLAVSRNRIKRLLKESFSKNANNYVYANLNYNFVFVYFASEVPSLSMVDRSMKSLLLSFKNKVQC